DLHWADDATRELLRQMLSPAPPPRVLAVFTSRPAWKPFDGVATLTLDRLSDAQAREQIAALLGKEVTPEVVDRLIASIPLLRAGNPLYTAQVVRSLVHEGLLRRSGEGLAIDERRLASYAAPESVAVALRRTIERLSPAERRVLGVGAMLGRQFQLDVLGAIGVADGAEIERVIA